MKYEAADLLSNYGGEIRENYSGRGMMGEQTTAIIFDDEQEFFKAVAGAIRDCVEDQNMEETDLLCSALKRIHTDSMGKSIIYY